MAKKFLWQEWDSENPSRKSQLAICWKADTIEEIMELIAHRETASSGGDVTILSKDSGRYSFKVGEKTKYIELREVRRRKGLLMRMLRDKFYLVIL